MQRALCFDDVLLIPQYSEVESRSKVDLTVPGIEGGEASLTPNHSHLKCPIVGSPMDTVMGAASAALLAEAGGFGVLHRYCGINDAVNAYSEAVRLMPSQFASPDFPMVNRYNVMVAIGATGDYLERAQALYDAGCRAFCIDVAHGHHLSVKTALKEMRSKFGDEIHIMSGNVATLEAFNDLADWGSNSVRVGIGGGCFIPGTSITMADGTKKPIELVKVGDSVLTHTGEAKEVINVFERPFSDLLVKINDTLTCTLNHEIYVIENKDIPNINDENIHEFARWIPAADLNENYSLIEII